MFAKSDVNTGRQVELDYMKGLFIPLILLIHAFQMLGGPDTPVAAYKIIYIIATMTGAAIFMFVLGVGGVYSKKDNKQLVAYGAKLIVMQILWNLISLALPMLIGQLVRIVSGFAPNWDLTFMRVSVLAGYINVFFVAGMCYFVIAGLKALKLPAWGYIAFAVVLFVVNPFLYMLDKSTGNKTLDYILRTFAGGRAEVSLSFLTLLPHALLGVGFGKYLRRTKNKGRLYAVLSVPLLIVVAVYFVYAITSNPSLVELYSYSDKGYVYPDVLRAFANASCVILLAGAMYALKNVIGKCKVVHSLLTHFCKNNTPYYAIHPFYFCLVLSVAGYIPFSAGSCTVIAVVVGVLCYGTILIWNKIKR